jgi:hypothetical protein
MRAGCKEVEGDWRERRENGLHKRFPSGVVFRSCPVNAVQQFRCCDGGDPDIFSRAEGGFKAPSDLAHRAAPGKRADDSLRAGRHLGG